MEFGIYGIVQSGRQSSPLIDLLADEIVGDLVALAVEVLVVTVGAGGVEGLLVYHNVFPQNSLRRGYVVDLLLTGAFCLVQAGARPHIVFYAGRLCLPTSMCMKIRMLILQCCLILNPSATVILVLRPVVLPLLQ